jgi:hypothetical protein
MFKSRTNSAALLAVAAAACVFSQDNASAAQTPTNAITDMGKLSSRGSQAFDDIRQARLAIFRGRPAQATKLLNQAQQSMKVAEKDNTAFLKAESDFKSPPSMTPQSSAAKNTTPVSWLPVGADVTVTDDFAAKPAQSKAAIKVLSLADVNVSYTMAVVPLKQTVADVDKAAGLLAADKYYEADQVMRQVQDSVRYDWIDVKALPQQSRVVAKNSSDTAASGTVTK